MPKIYRHEIVIYKLGARYSGDHFSVEARWDFTSIKGGKRTKVGFWQMQHQLSSSYLNSTYEPSGEVMNS